ncbi:MAG TPA: maleylacetate reductase [Pseudonocardiaceae bacterium]
MTSFVHELATGRVVFGAGALTRVADEVRRLHARRVLLIGGGHEKVYADAIADDLGELLAGRIDEVVQHVPVAVAAEATRTATELAADLLLCVGGGSATGLAKAVALRCGIPVLAVPTTYAGSEMSDIWGLTEADHKTTGRDRRVLPQVVVYDPELTVSMPAELTAMSGMNSLAHAVEARYAPDASPIVALIAEESVRALARALPVCVRRPDDLDGRSGALYGAFLAGVALGNATMGVHHKICHVLGGAYNLPHGGVHSAVLPYAVAYNRDCAPEAMRRLAAALGATDAALAVWRLADRIGAPTDLVSVGFDPAAIGEVAAAVAAAPPANPRPVTEQGVRELLAAACRGEPPRLPVTAR